MTRPTQPILAVARGKPLAGLREVTELRDGSGRVCPMAVLTGVRGGTRRGVSLGAAHRPAGTARFRCAQCYAILHTRSRRPVGAPRPAGRIDTRSQRALDDSPAPDYAPATQLTVFRGRPSAGRSAVAMIRVRVAVEASQATAMNCAGARHGLSALVGGPIPATTSSSMVSPASAPGSWRPRASLCPARST